MRFNNILTYTIISIYKPSYLYINNIITYIIVNKYKRYSLNKLNNQYLVQLGQVVVIDIILTFQALSIIGILLTLFNLLLILSLNLLITLSYITFIKLFNYIRLSSSYISLPFPRLLIVLERIITFRYFIQLGIIIVYIL